MIMLYVLVLLTLLIDVTVLSFSINNKHLSRQPLRLLNMAFMTHYEEIPVKTNTGTSLIDITSQITDIVTKCGCKEGVVTVLSKHSTVGIIIQEMEPRFVVSIILIIMIPIIIIIIITVINIRMMLDSSF